MKKSNILITGVTGFIGSHVAEALLSQGSYSIIAIVRKNRNEGKVEALKQKGVAIVEGEFYDTLFLERVFQEHRIDHVIHLAALRGAGKGAWEEYTRVNVTGTEVLLRAALDHGVKRFIYCSTVGVYGTIPSEVPANLSTRLHGDTAYHRSKILAEGKVKEFIHRGLDAFIVRPTITYGPGDDGFPKILVDLIREKKLLLPRHDVTIHLLSVSYVANLIAKMLSAEGLRERVFIVADENPIPLRKLADMIHGHYYQSRYPGYLTLPGFVFDGLVFIFRFLRNEKWSTRFLLISRNWYYDIQETIDTFRYLPSRTKNSFIQSIRNCQIS